MTSNCVDVRALFGRTYKIVRDPAYTAEYGPRARVADPWLDLIDCRYGAIGPWGGCRLLASTHGAGRVAAALLRLPRCEIMHDGDDGATVVFDLADFQAVAEIIKPRRKRRMSSESRRTRGMHLSKVRPQALSGA
jgi:hypothetical protein